MATDYTGTNTEKVDKVVGSVVELRTTVRLCLAAIGFGGPFMIGLLTFLVVQSFGTLSKVERLNDRLDRVEQKVDKLEQRAERIEQKVEKLEQRLDRLEQKLDRLADRLEQKLGK